MGIKITKEIILDEQDTNELIDVIWNVFDVEVTEKQLTKLLTLCPDWDGIVDTLGKEDVMDSICKHFTGMSVPMNGDQDEYKNKFYKLIEDKKQDFLEFINE